MKLPLGRSCIYIYLMFCRYIYIYTCVCACVIHLCLRTCLEQIVPFFIFPFHHGFLLLFFLHASNGIRYYSYNNVFLTNKTLDTVWANLVLSAVNSSSCLGLFQLSEELPREPGHSGVVVYGWTRLYMAGHGSVWLDMAVHGWTWLVKTMHMSRRGLTCLAMAKHC